MLRTFGLVLGEMVKQTAREERGWGRDGDLKGKRVLSVKSFSTFSFINRIYP